MIVFVLRRLWATLFILFAIVSLTFVLLRFLPGGPFDEEVALSPLVQANLESQYGLDQPLLQQYGQYIASLFRGDLGNSYKHEERAVIDIIGEAIPASFQLGFFALVLSFLIGIPLGLWAASKRGAWVDSTVMALAAGGVSLPSFLIAPIFIYIFSFGWPLNHWFPGLYQTLLDQGVLLPPALWTTPRHYILPVLTLSLRPAAFIARLTRTSVLDVIASDFVRTARAKGVDERVLLYRHVLRNSLIPLLTYAGPLMAGILTGSFVVEVIFAVPGIAKYFVQSVFNRDYPLIMGFTLVFSTFLLFINFAIDILYQVVDPRVEGGN